MTEQHLPPDAPLIPMPALTPAALRSAVAQIAPARLPEFGEHLDRAAEQAAAQSTITPCTPSSSTGGVRRGAALPRRAARLRELEAAADSATDPDTLARLVAEIQQILAEAHREVAA
ncbi:hypothetical protein ACFQXA_18805 [Nocardiopsis composta]